MRLAGRFFFPFVLCALLSCSPLLSAASLDQPFPLEVSESADLEGIAITFKEVDGDSRCPVDVNCFTAGQATVVLHFTAKGGEPTERRVAVPPDGAASTEFGDFTFEVSLEPAARSDEAAEDRQYRTTLTASKKSP